MNNNYNRKNINDNSININDNDNNITSLIFVNGFLHHARTYLK